MIIKSFDNQTIIYIGNKCKLIFHYLNSKQAYFLYLYNKNTDKSVFEKKINTEDDLVLNRVAKSSADTRVIEKRIAKTINERKQFDLEQRQEYTIDKKIKKRIKSWF